MERTTHLQLLKKTAIAIVVFVSFSCQTNPTIDDDRKELEKLFIEIETLVESVSCTNAADWRFVAYGAKACGGPQGYIAYPNTIDTVNFLLKVTNYTAVENELNIKWGVFSTCDTPALPTAVECVNGVATFIY